MEGFSEPIFNEKGATLLIALFVLVMLTAIGIAAITTTVIDWNISGSVKVYQQNLLRASGAVIEAAAMMSRDPDPGKHLLPENNKGPESIAWLVNGSQNGEGFNPESGTWIYSGNGQNSAHSAIYDDRSGFVVVFKGLAPGASYDMTLPSRLWEYSIYGRSELGRGKTTVNSGYRQRF